MRDQMLTNVTVRRHNGQNAYGAWSQYDEECFPAELGDAIADEIVNRDSEGGEIEVGGTIWVWRKVQ